MNASVPQTPFLTGRRKWSLIGLALMLMVAWWAGGLAAWWRWKASQALELRHPDAAWNYAQRAFAWTGSTPEIEFLYARICRRQGRYAEMESHLQRMLPGSQPGSARWREKQIRERLFAAAQAGQLESTEAALNQYLQDPRDDEREICEAYLNACLANGRDPAAKTILEGWQATFPNDPLPAYFLGLIREHHEEFSGAEQSYSDSLQLQPDNYACIYARGRVRLILNQADGALADYRAAQDMPYPAAARIGEARCLKTLGQLELARQILKQVLSLPVSELTTSYQRFGHFPEYLAPEYELGTLELESGHADVACPLLKRVAQQAPHFLEGRQAYGDALRASGQPDLAKTEMQFVQESRQAMLEVDRLLNELQHPPQDDSERKTFLADHNTRIGELYLKYSSPKTGRLYLRRALAEVPDFARARALLQEERKL